jgi:hypothetical protein
MNNLFSKLSGKAAGDGTSSRGNEDEDALSSSPVPATIQQPEIAMLPLSNDNLTRFISMSPPYRGLGRFLQDAVDPVQIGRTYAVWPPEVEKLEAHGLVTDGESTPILFFELFLSQGSRLPIR